MSKKSETIYSLGNPKVEVTNDTTRVIITTKHGQKFEVIIGEENIKITTISRLGASLKVLPESNCSIIIREDD